MDDWEIVVSLIVAALYVAGFLSAVHVLMKGRTPQGAVAWLFFLTTVPFVSVFFYWVFGPRKYEGYLNARLQEAAPFDPVVDQLREAGEPFIVDRSEPSAIHVVLERLVRLPFLRGNRVELLIDGEETFRSIFEAIDRAEKYVLVQFYIVRDDDLGRRLEATLVAAMRRGVRVHFLFDEIGSARLSSAYLRRLREAGAQLLAFKTSRHTHRLQLNFRNHRKLVVVDGLVGFTGGANIGDEYLGHWPRLSPWRDTSVKLTGPAAQALQLSFLEDWHWATGEIPDWNWRPAAAPTGEDETVLILPTGPADALESCSLLFVGLINHASERLWIATPYFVFDVQITTALQLAAQRGVDVRIIVPERADHLSTNYAAWSYFDEVIESGCRMFLYREGFMHQKAMVIDDDLAMIGTANLDNRSMRLNFEIGALVESQAFAAEVDSMLRHDLKRSKEVRRTDFAAKPFHFRLFARFMRLFAPIL